MAKYSAMLVYFLFVMRSINLINTENDKYDPSLEIIRNEDAEEGMDFSTNASSSKLHENANLELAEGDYHITNDEVEPKINAIKKISTIVEPDEDIDIKLKTIPKEVLTITYEESHQRKIRKSNEIPETKTPTETQNSLGNTKHSTQYNDIQFEKEWEHIHDEQLRFEHEHVDDDHQEVYNKIIEHEEHHEQLLKINEGRDLNVDNNEELSYSDIKILPTGFQANEEYENIKNKEILNENKEVLNESEETIQDNTSNEIEEAHSNKSNEIIDEEKLEMYLGKIQDIQQEKEREFEKELESSKETMSKTNYPMLLTMKNSSKILYAIKETLWDEKETLEQIHQNEKETDESKISEKQYLTWNDLEPKNDVIIPEEENYSEDERNSGNIEIVEPPGYFTDIQTSPFKALPLPKTEQSEDDICSLPAKTGPCKAYFLRYFHNSKTKECETFVYGGCRRNSNNFKTLAECTKACVTITTHS